MIILQDRIRYLPFEQTTRGGPLFLNTTALAGSEDFTLPDQSTATIPVWTVPVNASRGSDVLIMWKVNADLPAVEGSVTYSNLNSDWSKVPFVERASVDYWAPWASGRWSVPVSGFPVDKAYTWDDIPLSDRTPSVYNPRAAGGSTGLIYIRDFAGESLSVAGGFGTNARYLEWFVAAEVVGGAIYPTRTIQGMADGLMKKITKTTTGIVAASRLNQKAVRAGKMTFANETNPNVARTFNAADELDSVILSPCGLDALPEDNVVRWARPGEMIPVTIFNYTGPRGFAGDKISGEAYDMSLNFAQVRRR